jgi:hypothetical protein
MNNYIITIICLIIILIGILSYSFFINSEKFDAAPAAGGAAGAPGGVLAAGGGAAGEPAAGGGAAREPAAGGAATTGAATGAATTGAATTTSLLTPSGYLKKNIKKVDDMLKSLTEEQLIGFLKKDTNGNLTVAAQGVKDNQLKMYFNPPKDMVPESIFISPLEMIIPMIVDTKNNILDGYSIAFRNLIICTYLSEGAPETDHFKLFAKTNNIDCTPPAPAAPAADSNLSFYVGLALVTLGVAGLLIYLLTLEEQFKSRMST